MLPPRNDKPEIAAVPDNDKPEVAPAPDAEAEPVLDTKLGLAIAEHLGIEAESLTGFVVAAEFENADGALSLSSVWSIATPVWRLEGFAHELLAHLGKTIGRP